jgi:ABC-type lipoprotein release transport system permease subunit
MCATTPPRALRTGSILIAPGIPFLYYLESAGIDLGGNMESFGMNIANKIYPQCSWHVILSVSAVIVALVILVSYLASRRISGLNIVRILKGEI